MKRILIVDDNKDNLYLLRVLLEGNGYDVQQAGNGSEALVSALTALPDMIVSDILMPVIDGFTLCRIWKADENLSRIPFVFYTATYTVPRDERLARDLGADAFFVKPLEPYQFLQGIQSIFDIDRENTHVPPRKPDMTDEVILKKYNEALVRKLENKMFESERINQELEQEIKAKNRVQKSLHESEERFSKAFQSSPMPMAISDIVSGVFMNVNKKWLDLTGYAMDEMIGHNLPELGIIGTGEDGDVVADKLSMEGPVKEKSFRIKNKSGEILDILWSSELLKLGERDVMLSVVQDVTDRKKAEDAVLDIKEQFERFMANLPALVFIKDREGRLIYANPSLKDLFGWHEAEGKLTVELLSAEIAKRMIADDMRAMENGSEVVHERIMDINGVEHYFETHKFSFYRANGESLLGGISIDETERRLAVNELKESERKLREAQEMACLGYWSWDVETGKVKWSDEVYKTFGLDPSTFTPDIDSILERSPWPEDHERGIELINRAIESREPGYYEQKFLRPDGSIGYYYSNFRGGYDESGNLVSINGTVMDITERKQAEDRLQRLYANLEHLVAMRTADLERTNNELESFSYTVSHDLRAPLRRITGFIDMFRMEAGSGLSEKAIHYMKVIEESAARMENLIADLLSFSRTGRVELTMKSVDMEALAGEVLGEFSDDIKRMSISVVRQPLPVVCGDRAMLYIVLMNLVANAVKFTSRTRAPEITIGCDKVDDEAVFFVSDNGVGFDMEHVNKLFGVFQRLHNESDFHGTGIGLATVKRIVERHGGHVWARGKKNSGACFYFSLPLKTFPHQ